MPREEFSSGFWDLSQENNWKELVEFLARHDVGDSTSEKTIMINYIFSLLDCLGKAFPDKIEEIKDFVCSLSRDHSVNNVFPRAVTSWLWKSGKKEV